MDNPFHISHLITPGLGGIIRAISDRPGLTSDQRETLASGTLNLIMSFLPRDVVEMTLCGHTVLFGELLADGARDVLRGMADNALKLKSVGGLVNMARIVQGNVDRLAKRGNAPAHTHVVAPGETKPAGNGADKPADLSVDVSDEMSGQASGSNPDAASPNAALRNGARPDAALQNAAPPDAALPDAALRNGAPPDAASPKAAPPYAAPADAVSSLAVEHEGPVSPLQISPIAETIAAETGRAIAMPFLPAAISLEGAAASPVFPSPVAVSSMGEHEAAQAPTAISNGLEECHGSVTNSVGAETRRAPVEETSWLDEPFEQWLIETPAQLTARLNERPEAAVPAPANTADQQRDGAGRSGMASTPEEPALPRQQAGYAPARVLADA